MRKTFLLIATFLGFSVLAQNLEKHPALDKQFGLEISLFGVGASYELPLSHNILTEISAGFSASNYNHNDLFGHHFKFAFDEQSPFAKVHFRRYYNRDNRFRKGKEINNNRGNYIGIDSKYFFTASEKTKSRLVNSLHWGIQTELANNLLFSFDFGLGHWYNGANEHSFFPIMGLKMKYILF